MASSIFEQPLPIYDFSFENIQNYILKINEENDSNGQSTVLKQSILGSKLFKSNFVRDFKFLQVNSEILIIQALVKAEYKKVTYDVSITVTSKNEVLQATCECPGGVSPSSCKHTFAVLAFMQDYCAKELHSAPTEKLQSWHQPSKKMKLSPKKTNEIFKASVHNKENSVSFSALKNLPLDSPIFLVIDDKDFNLNEHLINITMPLPHLNITEASEFRKEFSRLYLSIAEIGFFVQKVEKNLQQCQEIEKLTIGQNNELWRVERSLRLTSSNFHAIIKRKKDFNEMSLSICKPVDIGHLPALVFGRENERLVKEQIKKKYTNKIFRDVGLVINPNYPFLGTSPDGLLFSEREYALVEIKSIYDRTLSLSELAKKKDFCLEEDGDRYKLKKSHKYYTQIQGQLGICNLKKCFFFLSYSSELHVEEILFDETFWLSCLAKLKDFYFNFHLSNLIKEN